MSGPGERNLLDRDARALWHPYTRHGLEPEPLAVAEARGAVLTLEDGRELLDAISSWWTVLHGHAEPALVEAVRAQAARLDHVLFAGATHEPAVRLAERLLELAPGGLARVFYSDDGSTAVEVALKIARQHWVHRGEPERSVFVALDGAYHGDTFGAMSVGEREPFFGAFAPMLFEARHVPPEAGALARALDQLGPRAAGVLVEPMVQGAGGMRMHGAEFLRDARALCDRHGVPLIADEVMTGFGRTGALFACGKAGITPDLLCLAKGLSGGILPLAATLASEELFESFRSEDGSRALFHGHSFTANPIACAAGLASLDLCRDRDVPRRLDAIGAAIEDGLRERLGRRAEEMGLRRTGGIVALDLPRASPASASGKTGYLDPRSLRLRLAAIERGVLLRPLGPVLYAIPPSCTDRDQCARIAEVLAELATHAFE